MASTNHTQYYNLPQYVGTDKPTYLTDFNPAMLAIDTGIHEAKAEADVNSSNIGNLSSLSTSINTDLVSAINEVKGDVDDNTTALSSLNTQVSSNTGNIGTMANLTTQTKTSLVNAINEVNEKIDDSNKYILEEIAIGKWIDGRTLYRKVINFGSLPDTTTKVVSTGINGSYTITDLYGIAEATTGLTLTLPFSSSIDFNNNIQLVHTANKEILIESGVNRSNLNGIIFIEYVKN